MKQTPIISIVGRPNVGKSSLFNKIACTKRKALVHDEPGVTRDGNYTLVKFEEAGEEFPECDFFLVDTGGFFPKMVDWEFSAESTDQEVIWSQVAGQSMLAIKESDFCLVVVDIREGLLASDEEIIHYLRKTNRKFWLVINKCDTENQVLGSHEFAKIGIDEDEQFIISAEHSRGLSELLETLHALILSDALDINTNTTTNSILSTPDFPILGSFAIIGAPNVGKSTLLNEILGHKRSVVSAIAGTTVDPVEAYLNVDFGIDISTVDEFWNQQKGRYLGSNFLYREKETAQEFMKDSWRSLLVIDTAGIRRSSSVDGFIESQSVYRSLRCLSDADIVIYVIDVSKGLTHQDRTLIGLAIEKGRPILLALNKYDLVKKEFSDVGEKDEWHKSWEHLVPWLEFCQKFTISAKTGEGVLKLKKAIRDFYIYRAKGISTGELNRTISELLESRPLNIRDSSMVQLKIKYATIVKEFPLTILLFSNKSKEIPENYRKYLINGLREKMDLKNTPIHLIFRTNSDRKKREESLENEF